MPPLETKTPEELQDEIVKAMDDFAKLNPEIAQAMQVMNMSLADYLQAMEAARGGQTASYSSLHPVRA